MKHAALLLLALPGLLHAAERHWLVTSFDHVRVDGPFAVHIVAGSPNARATGPADALDAIDIRQSGNSVVIQANANGWGERPRAAEPGAVVIELATPALIGAAVTSSGRLTIEGLHGQAASLQVTGSGEIAASGIAADRLETVLIGTGQMTLAGRAAHARLRTNGPGTIDAAGLNADDVTVRLDGAGETQAHARYTADVTSTGLGTVTVEGPASCHVVAPAGGAVRCGDGRVSPTAG